MFWLNNGNIVTEAQLVIDEAIVARSDALSARKAVLCATLTDGDNSHAVEVLFGDLHPADEDSGGWQEDFWRFEMTVAAGE